MLPSTSSREALLACPPLPAWNLPFFTLKYTLSSPCSHSNPPPYLAKMRLSLTLTLSCLTIWCFEQTVLFIFLLAKAALAYLLTATLFFSAGPSKHKFFRQSLCHSASSLLVLASPTSLPLLFSSYLTLALTLPFCLLHIFFYLNLSGRTGKNCLLCSPVVSNYNGSPDTCFSQEQRG